jgi:hypothetical protein
MSALAVAMSITRTPVSGRAASTISDSTNASALPIGEWEIRWGFHLGADAAEEFDQRQQEAARVGHIARVGTRTVVPLGRFINLDVIAQVVTRRKSLSAVLG